MILISNIGNRDVLYQNKTLEREKIRHLSEEIHNNYENKKDELTYPLLEPFLRTFAQELKNIYIFVTNQEDERVRNTDTLYLGQIIQRWIKETYNKSVNVVQYTDNPTDYEKLYHFFTTYFTQKESLISKSSKRIISLSGGTPQMNGALYVILSSLYINSIEFYNVFNGELIPVNHERTINRIFIRKSCLELLKIYEYNSIVRILEKYNIKDQESLVLLLNYAHSRRNFDFEESQNYLVKFLDSVPFSHHQNYFFLKLDDNIKSELLIKELFWNMEISYKNRNYLFLVALLFRLEEALLYEITDYFFKNILEEPLSKKKTHPVLLDYLKEKEPEFYESLEQLTFRSRPLDLNIGVLNRTILFFLTKFKLEEYKKKNNYIFQIGNVLAMLDKINKYNYDMLEESEREKKYGDSTSMKCLGDLRNNSIIAHGFEFVSQQKIEALYKEDLQMIMKNLRKHIENLIKFLSKDNDSELENLFDKLNQVVLNFIVKI